jgi:hypothetical protein
MKKLLMGTALLFSLSSTARAETMEWTVTNGYGYQLQLSFFSQYRSAEWPGQGDAYELNDSAPRTYSLSCRTGEKICYGAWVNGGDRNGRYKSWGVGATNEHDCTDCCAICGEEDPAIRLLP